MQIDQAKVVGRGSEECALIKFHELLIYVVVLWDSVRLGRTTAITFSSSFRDGRFLSLPPTTRHERMNA